MNICVLTHTYPRFSGDPVAPFMKDFCRGLVEQKQNVFLLIPYDKLFAVRQNTTSNLKVKLYRYIIPNRLHTLGYSRTLVGDQQLKTRVFFLAPFMFVSGFFSLLSLVYQKKIQIISAHWIVPNGFIGALVSKITGVPLVITVPGSDVYLGKKNLFFRWMTTFSLSQAKVIVSNSMHYLEELANMPIDKTKFVEIPYGINVRNFANFRNQRGVMRKQLKLPSSDFIILAVGRLVEKKGFAYLISAMPDIIKKEGKVKLVIIGDGSQRKSLEQLTQKLGIQQKVLFLGSINHTDLPKYYGLADVYVSPSVKDKQGNLESHTVALFEAIASGLPIVATKLAVSKQYVDGKNGYRVNDRDSNDLASAIIKVLNSNNLSDMGKQSSDIAKKYLSYQFCTNEYIKIFKEIVTS